MTKQIYVNEQLALELSDLKGLLELRQGFRMAWDALHAAHAVTGNENLLDLQIQLAIEGVKINDLIIMELERLADRR